MRAFTGLVLALLVLPLAAIVPLSFTSSELLSLPIPGWSVRWYGEVLTDPRWLEAARTSLLLGVLTVLIAVPLGTLAALGLRFGRVPGGGGVRRGVIAVVLAPVVAPSVITGLAMYLAFAQVGLTSTMTGLVVAHVVLCAPYGFTAVLAGLQGFDASLLLAARGLGASPAGAVRRVLLPILAPAVGAGAVFAFAISFDELVITMFLAGPEQRTLPRQMYAGLRETISPALAAAAVLLAGASVGLLGVWRMMQRRA